MLALLLLPLAAHAGWDPARDGARSFNKGVDALDIGEVEEAESRFRESLERSPDCGSCLDALGVALLRQGKLAEAAATAAKATELHPDVAKPWVTLATVRFAQQDFQGALTAAVAGVAAEQDSVQALATQQEVLLRLGDTATAHAAIESARGRLPDADLACLDLLVLSEQGDRAAAEARLDTCHGAGLRELVVAAEAELGADVVLTGNLARVVGAETTAATAQAIDLMNDAAWAEAESLLDGVLAKSPDNVGARMLRARCRYEQRRLVDARADLEKAFSGEAWVDVHRSGVLTGVIRASQEQQVQEMIEESAGVLVTIMVEQGELAEARAWLVRARTEQGATPALAAAEVRIHQAEGDTAAAWSALDAGLAAHPTNRSLLNLAGELSLGAPEQLDAHPVVAQSMGSSGAWTDRYNLAAARANGGRYRACLDVVDAAAPFTAEDGLVRFRQVAYRCALGASDLARADELLPKVADGDPSMVDPRARVNHAILCYQSDRYADALALLTDLPEDDAALRVVATSIGLKAHVKLLEYDDALTLARRPEADPQDAAWLASKLARDGRTEDARGLLAGACPRLEGEAAEDCRVVLGQLD